MYLKCRTCYKIFICSFFSPIHSYFSLLFGRNLEGVLSFSSFFSHKRAQDFLLVSTFIFFSYALSETNANLRILYCFWEIDYLIYSAQDGIWNLNLKFYFQSVQSDHSDTRIVNRFIWKLFMVVLGVIYIQTPLARTLRNTVTVDATKVFTIPILMWP